MRKLIMSAIILMMMVTGAAVGIVCSMGNEIKDHEETIKELVEENMKLSSDLDSARKLEKENKTIDERPEVKESQVSEEYMEEMEAYGMLNNI